MRSMASRSRAFARKRIDVQVHAMSRLGVPGQFFEKRHPAAPQITASIFCSVRVCVIFNRSKRTAGSRDAGSFVNSITPAISRGNPMRGGSSLTEQTEEPGCG